MNQKGPTTFSSHERGLAPILIVLLIAAAGIGGYFIYTNFRQKIVDVYYSNNRTKTTPPQTIQATAQPSPSPSDQTTNWKTYRNEKFGFEFKHPEYWAKENFCRFGYPFCLNTIEYSSLPSKKDLNCDVVGCGGDPGIILINTKEDLTSFVSSIDNRKVPEVYNSYWGWEITKIGGRNAIKSYIYYAPSGKYFIFSLLSNKDQQSLLSLSVELQIEPVYKPEKVLDSKISVDVEKSEAKLTEIRNGIVDSQTKKIINDYNLLLSTFKFIK